MIFFGLFCLPQVLSIKYATTLQEEKLLKKG